jgi:hypothetical protein
MSSKLKTPKALLSYPHLHLPQASDDGKAPKYSACLIFTPEVLADPTEKAFFDAMQAAALEAINAKWPGKAQQLLQSEGFKKGFRRDAEAKGYPAGSIYINVRSTQQPGIVFAYAGPDGKPARMTQEQIKEHAYAGAIVRATVSPFAYDNSGNKGVSFGLNNLQKLGDGPRLDGRVAAENEFDVDLSAAPADLESLI